MTRFVILRKLTKLNVYKIEKENNVRKITNTFIGMESAKVKII